MHMDDELPTGVWSLDPETRTALRLDRVRRMLRDEDYVEAVVEVEELLDEEPDNPEGLFLLGESLLELREPSIALLAYERFVELTGGDADSLLGLAISRYEVCDLAGAAVAAREAVRLDPSRAEAHWYLGLALERLPGRRTEALQAFAAARELDPTEFPFPLRLSDSEWRGAIGMAVGRLHPRLQSFWDGIPVRLEPWPDLAELRRADPPITPAVSGLYLGEPPTEGDPWIERPKAMRLFRHNLERARDPHELLDQITQALQDEALDWLGVADVSEFEEPTDSSESTD